MGVFNSTTHCKRAVSDPLSDQTLPNPASLSWSDVTGVTALAGTTGDHCGVVHGDRTQEFRGSTIDHVNGNHKLTITGDQTIKIGGNHKETILQDCYQSIIGPHIVTNQTVRNETRMGRFSETFGEFDHLDDHHDRLYRANTLTEIVLAHLFEYQTMKLEFEPLHIELKLLHPAIIGVDVGAYLLDVAEHGSQANEAIMINSIRLSESEIRCMMNHLGILKPKLKAACTLVDPNGTVGC